MQALDIGSLLAANAAAQKNIEEAGEGGEGDDAESSADGDDGDAMIDPALRDTEHSKQAQFVGSGTAAAHRPPIFATQDSFPTPGHSSVSVSTVTLAENTNGLPAYRAGLQKSLAMLAAQLADIAGVPIPVTDLSANPNTSLDQFENGRLAAATVSGWISYEQPV